MNVEIKKLQLYIAKHAFNAHAFFFYNPEFFEHFLLKQISLNDARKAIRFTLKEIPLVIIFSPIPTRSIELFTRVQK